jgi:coenzyme F420 hydrogenase subunit beta
MKALEAIVNLRREAPARVKHMIPGHVWRLAQPYGLAPGAADEVAAAPAIARKVGD